MARPPLPVGTYGKVDFLTLDNGQIRARARYRDHDGTTRPVTRFASTKAGAERALKLAIRDRTGPMSGDVTAETRVRDLVTMWLTDVDTGDLTARTKEHYRYVTDRYVLPGMGGLRLREVTAGSVDRLLKSVLERNGAGAAKSTRSVVSSLLGVAVRHGALPNNPVRDVARLGKPRKIVRALTPVESTELVTFLRADERAVELDLPDLVEFMLGTGVRVGEALAVRPAVVDLDGRVIEINATVVRTKGHGVTVQEHPKTAAGWRVIAVPEFVAEIVGRRANSRPVRAADVVFASPLGHVRDASNTSSDLRRALNRAEFEWVTSHTFRKTVATRLDEAGLSARQIADHLGHARPSVTQDVYMGRNVVSTRAAEVLQAGRVL
jgi:integrase